MEILKCLHNVFIILTAVEILKEYNTPCTVSFVKVDIVIVLFFLELVQDSSGLPDKFTMRIRYACYIFMLILCSVLFTCVFLEIVFI